jgi:hypothetical protein
VAAGDPAPVIAADAAPVAPGPAPGPATDHGHSPDRRPPRPDPAGTRPRPPVAADPGRAPEPADPAAGSADLRAGEDALASGDFNAALHRAEKVIRATPRSPLAHALRAKAYCGRQDLGNAIASLRNVPGRLRPAVSRFCAAHGIELR